MTGSISYLVASTLPSALLLGKTKRKKNRNKQREHCIYFHTCLRTWNERNISYGYCNKPAKGEAIYSALTDMTSKEYSPRSGTGLLRETKNEIFRWILLLFILMATDSLGPYRKPFLCKDLQLLWP